MMGQRYKQFKSQRIPEHTVSRLSLYFRCLRTLQREGMETISSEKFARRFGLNAAQMRKDLAYFGEFGIRGVGYDVFELKNQLQNILGLDDSWPMAMVGLGNLGQALMRYRGFEDSGFRIVRAFDVDPKKVQQTPFNHVTYHSMEDAEKVLQGSGIRMAILAVPAPAAQATVDTLVRLEIDGILNFAPVNLKVPAHVRVRNVDLTFALENLAFYVTHKDTHDESPIDSP